MVTPSTMPSTSAYKPFQVEFWLLGKQFVVTEAEHAGGRAELGKLIPPRLVLPMKYCNVFCEFCWPSSRTKSRSEEHTSELQSLTNLVCRLLLEKKKCMFWIF